MQPKNDDVKNFVNADAMKLIPLVVDRFNKKTNDLNPDRLNLTLRRSYNTT